MIVSQLIYLVGDTFYPRYMLQRNASPLLSQHNVLHTYDDLLDKAFVCMQPKEYCI